MEVSKQVPASAEHRGHHSSLSVNAASIPHNHQQGWRSMAEDSENNNYSAPEFETINDNLMEGDEQQMQRQQQMQKQQSEHDDVHVTRDTLRNDNAQLREQRSDYPKEHVKIQNKLGLQDTNNILEKKYKKLKERYNWFKEYTINLEDQHKFINSRYNSLVRNIVKHYTQLTGLKWDHQTSATIDVMTEPLVKDALEASSLRDQVRELQKEMLTRIDKGDPISDEQFAQAFRNLSALIKTLSRTIRVTEGVDVVKILQDPVMLRNVSAHHWVGRARTKCMIEAWVWSILLLTVFDTPFSAFGHEGKGAMQAWVALFEHDHAYNWPIPSALCESWRCMTAEVILENMVAQGAVTGGNKTKVSTAQEESILKACDITTNIMGSRLAVTSPSVNLKLIRQIVEKALALAVQMSTQRPRLQVTYPAIRAQFDREAMTPLRGCTGKDIENGMVAFIVNPGLTKWGDVHGQNLDRRYDIIPALVQLEPFLQSQRWNSSGQMPWSAASASDSVYRV